MKSSLPETLNAARSRRGMTLSEVAAALRISRTYACYLETGERSPSPALLGRICDLWKLPRTRVAKLAWPEFWRE